jgi:hypothetical protein
MGTQLTAQEVQENFIGYPSGASWAKGLLRKPLTVEGTWVGGEVEKCSIEVYTQSGAVKLLKGFGLTPVPSGDAGDGIKVKDYWGGTVQTSDIALPPTASAGMTGFQSDAFIVGLLSKATRLRVADSGGGIRLRSDLCTVLYQFLDYVYDSNHPERKACFGTGKKAALREVEAGRLREWAHTFIPLLVNGSWENIPVKQTVINQIVLGKCPPLTLTGVKHLVVHAVGRAAQFTDLSSRLIAAMFSAVVCPDTGEWVTSDVAQVEPSPDVSGYQHQLQKVSKEEAFGMEKVPLNAATKIFQPVNGTSGTSRYHLVGHLAKDGSGDTPLSVGARYTGAALSVRVEGADIKKYTEELERAGFAVEDGKLGNGYVSIHLDVSSILLANKTLASIIAATGMAVTAAPDLGDIYDE